MPGNDNLKGKRRVLQSVMARLRESFNVAVAETGENDKWQVATLSIAAVANDAAYVHGLLTHALESIEHSRADATVLDYSIEIL